MMYDENDIKYNDINEHEFEELCFDLLVRLGFHSLIWRQGGADSGRDLEGLFSVSNPLVRSYEEKWFFECKHYMQGVPVAELYSKIAWADAEHPNHLVFFISSYMSNNTRTWLRQIQPTKLYKIHVIEGKQLKALVLPFTDIIDRYFIDKYRKLLADTKRNWAFLNIFPDPQTLYLIQKNVDLSKLSLDYLALLWCFWRIKQDEIEVWTEDSDLEISFESIADRLKSSAKQEKSLISELRARASLIVKYSVATSLGDDKPFGRELRSDIVAKRGNTRWSAIHCITSFGNGEGIEVLIESKSDILVQIRHIKDNVSQEIEYSWRKELD